MAVWPTNAPIFPKDTAIADQYVVEALLDNGESGAMYRAIDARTQRPVVVKVLHPRPIVTAEADARFRREGKALSQINHPNIVTLYAFGNWRELRYIVMECVEGEKLAFELQRRGHLELGESVSIARAVASGLAEVHSLGIVHRDVRASNILLRRLASGRAHPKLIGFGLVRNYQEVTEIRATREFSMPGTPGYMAPEQIHRRPLDGRADIYALGVVLFEMLTGRLPFPRSAGAPAQLIATLNEAPPRLGDVSPGPWPDVLELEIERALAKDPADRHSSMMAFEAALGAV